jgi:hypothetical protein
MFRLLKVFSGVNILLVCLADGSIMLYILWDIAVTSYLGLILTLHILVRQPGEQFYAILRALFITLIIGKHLYQKTRFQILN